MYVSELVKLIPNIVEYEIVSDCEIIGAELDSRSVKANNIFFGTKGEILDGNKFANKAIDMGAACVVMSDKAEYDNVKGNKFLVTDTIKALKTVGYTRFKTCRAKKIAITGSFGKTGLKDMLNEVLSVTQNVYATAGNKNNELGTALTGAGIDDNAEVIIVELGSNSSGEIEALSKIVNPDIAVVVSAGSAHIGMFGTYENIIKEKLSISSGLNKDGLLIIPKRLSRYLNHDGLNVRTFSAEPHADYFLTSFKHDYLSIEYTAQGSDEVYRINHPYKHIAVNSLVAIAIAQQLDMATSDIRKGLEKYTPMKMHGNIVNIGELVIIDDTYNAGFESILTSIEAIHEIDIKPKHIVLGEMLEITGYESDLYDKLIDKSNKYKDVNFILCGKQFKKYENTDNRIIFAEKLEAMDYVANIKEGIMLIKAARAMRFEDFITMIKQSGASNAI